MTDCKSVLHTASWDARKKALPFFVDNIMFIMRYFYIIMKSRSAYVLLVCGLLVLIVAAAGLTQILFDLSVPDIQPNPGKQETRRTAPPDIPVLAETFIEVAGRSPVPSPDIEQEHHKKREVVSAATETGRSPQPEQQTRKAVGTETEAGPAGIGEVVLIHGTAYATGAAEQRRALSLHSRVFPNEKIETGPDTRLKIKFDDRSILSQGENSVIVIDHYLYDTSKPANNRFVMRFLKGACRLVTGVITDINPGRFKVRMRMATIGIRGCDLAFNSTFERDDIYVMALSGEQSVRVETTEDGSQVMNLLTGQKLLMNNSSKTIIDVVESGHLVTIIRGEGVKQRRIKPEDVRQIMYDTSHLVPASYDILLKPDAAILTLQPEEKTPSGEAAEESREKNE